MPGTAPSEAPSVSLSFANNFWGRDDAGVAPLLERMHNAKVTGDELKAFYTARAQIEDEYARKLLNLARKPLGSSESGTLRMSLDVVRGETDSMAKAHQHVATQMKSELEEPLSAFTGGIKERRKIVQGGIEKLLKNKTQQTSAVNKTRDRYEQDCLKIKGYLAQGHMVMGQEERKNKAKLEKTQIQLSATSNEYEAAVRVLEETTTRWNRDWKGACDKFQDLEEERIDFMKSSLWSFANIASTVCVSDDASCEKVRLSLEDCDVEKDITRFIKDQGTGQEIPDAPKFVNFCRGDINDNASDASGDAYSVAQFQRTVNPAFRSSSPQPSAISSHHTPEPEVVNPLDLSRRPSQGLFRTSQNSRPPLDYDELPRVPHNEYPPDGMTQFCRIGPPASDRSSIPSPTRLDIDDRSEYSNPTSNSSLEPTSGHQSPEKQFADDKSVPPRRKNGFFQQHSPFHRRNKEKDPSASTPTATQRPQSMAAPTSARHGQNIAFNSDMPVDPRSNFQLNVGNNVFDVASPDQRQRIEPAPPKAMMNDDFDPIAQALADLKVVGKQSSVRVPADRHNGMLSSGPNSPAAQRSSPSTYESRPVGHLGAPQPAFTSRQMQQTTASYVSQKQNMFGRPGQEPRAQSAMSNRRMNDVPRAASPAPLRSPSTAPYDSRDPYRGKAPNGNIAPQMGRSQSSSPTKYSVNGPSHAQGQQIVRARSPQPQFDSRSGYSASPGPDSDSRQPRPTSQYYGDGPYAAVSPVSSRRDSTNQALEPRERKHSVGAQRKVTRDGRPILHFSRAIYLYQAAIPEELSFNKGDVLAVLRHQDDGWWEAEIAGAHGRTGLVPSNYLKAC